LDRSDIDSFFKEVSGEGMPKGMTGGGFRKVRFASRFFEMALHRVFVEMESGDPACFRVWAKSCSWKKGGVIKKWCRKLRLEANLPVQSHFAF